MIGTRHAIGLLMTTVIAATPLSAVKAWTSVAKPVFPNAVQSPGSKPTKTPHVSGRQTKDGAQLRGTGHVDSRLADSMPSRPDKPKTASGDKGRNTWQVPSASGRNKETPAAKTPDRVDLKLNIGICGLLQPDGTMPGPHRCQPEQPQAPRRTVPQVVTPRPQDVLWEQVLAETKDVLFPGLTVSVQPKGRTLVNLDTIVYTDESKVSATTITLLGFPVQVEATPMSYIWNFGDGTVLTTSTPGRPYPAKEITHKYLKRGAVSITLTTNYAARFNVANTGWQYVDGTVPITGPTTPLQVREAAPVIVDPPN